jgi:hypothetical protein
MILIEHENGWGHMLNREYIKNEIDALPDFVLEKVRDFIDFQKFSLGWLEHDQESIRDLVAASESSTGFWDNPDDEVWDHV